MNKKKIIKDPVYGFISIPSAFVLDIIEHPYFQRLRRIKQLGVTDLIYPGAIHTRFNHALGAMHLMSLALDTLKSKGHVIEDHEYEAAIVAILLHDLGHGPFSHVLEKYLLDDVSHETLSLLIMQKLNREFDGKLQLAIDIFEGTYPRPFFHQLVSSQLDMDRMDYLNRDCFYTGVDEGTIGGDRIIRMINLVNDELVFEEKAIYSIENFLSARRLMYWQVYLHKTTVSVEQMLNSLIMRARHLVKKEHVLFGSPALLHFLKKKLNKSDVENNEEALNHFLNLDDHDIWGAIKVWTSHPDEILRDISLRLVNRQLFKVTLSNQIPDKKFLSALKKEKELEWQLDKKDIKYYFHHGDLSNSGYMLDSGKINILMKNGDIQDITVAADLPNIKAMSKIVRKYYLCFPKTVYLPKK